GGDLGLTSHVEFAEMFDCGRIDIAQPDISMVGGYTEVLKVAEVAKKRGKRLVTHGYKTNLLIATNLHFLAQHFAEEMCEYSTSESPLRWELTRERFPIGADGRIEVPRAPGLGVSLDPAAIAR